MREHGKRIDVEGVGLVRARRGHAQVVLARHLAGGRELALGPVAHELEAGLVVDDHGGGQVPVAACRILVDVGLHLAQGVEHLEHGRAGQFLLVQLEDGLLVEFRAAHAQRDGFKHGGVLPWLAAVGDRDAARFLDLLGRVEERIPGGRGGGHAGFFQHFRIDPHPVDAVDVDGSGNVVALVFHDVGDDFRQHGIPFAWNGGIIDIGQHAFRAPLLDRWALDLGGGRRIAGNDAGLQRGRGVFASAASHGEVFPAEAAFLHDLLQLAHGLRFAAGGPVVQHFHVGRKGAAGECQGGQCGQLGNLEFQFHLHIPFLIKLLGGFGIRGPKKVKSAPVPALLCSDPLANGHHLGVKTAP